MRLGRGGFQRVGRASVQVVIRGSAAAVGWVARDVTARMVCFVDGFWVPGLTLFFPTCLCDTLAHNNVRVGGTLHHELERTFRYLQAARLK